MAQERTLADLLLDPAARNVTGQFVTALSAAFSTAGASARIALKDTAQSFQPRLDSALTRYQRSEATAVD